MRALVALLFVFVVTTAPIAAAPLPQWTYTPRPPASGPLRIGGASPKAILLEGDWGGLLIGVDRSTGKELWRRKTEGRLIAGAGVGRRSLILHYVSRNSWIGVDDSTGKDLWRVAEPPQTLLSRPTVYGNVFISCFPSGSTTATIRDTITGVVATPAARREAARAYGSTLVPVPGVSGLKLVDLLTGSYTTATIPRYASLVTREGDRVVLRIDTDDDYAGHSQWPKYLYCCDLQGKKRWQFPKAFRYRDEYKFVAANSVREAVYVKQAKNIIALDDDAIYGVSLRTGRVLWRVKSGAFSHPAQFGRGILALAQKDEPNPAFTSLIYVDARTGRTRRLARLPLSNGLLADGGAVFVVTARKELLMFRAGDLPIPR